ncbi:MAG: tyrosine-type recombinase/integrase [Candidatus Devosia phytovorans]|uniref:Tyrosine-type recombinase/integrase n=1 Tax=Candidatus Devosia phytovorans TaxID=3121372 RepID=A0AAJ5VUF8_9HYPH|nr:tyrosine-type recombinase/integrase [Devosia sp.]WEK03797.1 MAG: tyrosine-type recombinase/integrase [Devosia sp.]
MKHHTPMAHRHQRPAGFLLGGRPDLADWRKCLDRLDGSYSPHTLLSYRSDFGSFETWCKDRGLKYLPAASSTVAAYITAETERLKPSTLKRKLAGIRKIHYLLRLRDPTYDVDVDLAIRRARRLKPQRPSQALGVTAALRDRLLAATTDDLSGLRDRALVSVGFDTLCRRGELVALHFEDIEPNHFGTASLLIRRAKNDPEGAGRIAHLTAGALESLTDWVEAAQIEGGPLFRPVYGKFAIDRFMNPIALTRILKKLAVRAGFTAEEVFGISGHSLRVGAAQQLTLNGVQLLPIMRAGGWRSMNVVARYVENVDINVWGS